MIEQLVFWVPPSQSTNKQFGQMDKCNNIGLYFTGKSTKTFLQKYESFFYFLVCTFATSKKPKKSTDFFQIVTYTIVYFAFSMAFFSFPLLFLFVSSSSSFFFCSCCFAVIFHVHVHWTHTNKQRRLRYAGQRWHFKTLLDFFSMI